MLTPDRGPKARVYAELTSHLHHASNGASVRWRAIRARLNYLLSAALKEKDEEKPAKDMSAKSIDGALPQSEQKDDRAGDNGRKNATKTRDARSEAEPSGSSNRSNKQEIQKNSVA
jgi:hypothetical protein